MANTIVFKKKKFITLSVLKSKSADELVKRYKVLYPSFTEAEVRELYKLAKGPEAKKVVEEKTEK